MKQASDEAMIWTQEYFLLIRRKKAYNQNLNAEMSKAKKRTVGNILKHLSPLVEQLRNLASIDGNLFFAFL